MYQNGVAPNVLSIVKPLRYTLDVPNWCSTQILTEMKAQEKVCSMSQIGLVPNLYLIKSLITNVLNVPKWYSTQFWPIKGFLRYLRCAQLT